MKDRPRNRRKIIFIISDGVNGGKKYNTNTFDNTVKEVLAHSISVFAVGVGSAFYDRSLSGSPNTRMARAATFITRRKRNRCRIFILG